MRRRNSRSRRNKKKNEERIRMARQNMENPKAKACFTWFFQILATLAISSMIAICFFQPVTMQEGAMQPTISAGDKFLMNQIIYKVTSPKRGDIVAFRTSGSDDANLYIRRIIGLPGENVQIQDGKILINGNVYEENLDLPDIKNSGLAEEPIYLEPGEYFVLGDNRNNSEDSRYPDIGVVKKKYMEGKLWVQIFPADKRGWLE